MSKPVIFSGIQPTGNIHLGVYLGAIKNWIELQNSGDYQIYFFIADLHSLSGDMTAEKRREQIKIAIAEILAAGIDPEKVCFFLQSDIPEHAELMWILSSVTSVAELERMTQFKDKSQKQTKNVNAGLLNYPILQAADILLYHGTLVPIGKDQVQHLELTNDILRWFNKRYGEYFAEVKPLLTQTPKIMSLLDPAKKMSKSEGGDGTINLADEPEEIVRKLKKAVTATEGGGNSPGSQNLLLLLKEFGTKEEYNEFSKAEKDGSIRYGDLKKVLADSISNYFSEFRKRRAELLNNPEELRRLLERGAEHAREVAQKTMSEVRKRIGIR